MTDNDPKFDKVEGTVKETAGKITGDKDTEADGRAQKTEGKVKDGLEDAKAGLKAAGSRLKDALGRDKDK